MLVDELRHGNAGAMMGAAGGIVKYRALTRNLRRWYNSIEQPTD